MRTLEGHTGFVANVAFSRWSSACVQGHRPPTSVMELRTWETLAVIPCPGELSYFSDEPKVEWQVTALAFHPKLPMLAASAKQRSETIQLWELDLELLLGKRVGAAAAAQNVHHTTGKIVLVGDHSVGKSALGYRLIYGEFKEQLSTHGQQFWVFPPFASAEPTGRNARQSCGISRASQTTGLFTRFSSTTRTWRWFCLTPRTYATRCMA